MNERARDGLLGAVPLLERATGYTLGSLNLITAGALGHPTPCPDWELGALLEHMDDSMAALYKAADTGLVDPTPLYGGSAPAAGTAAMVRERAHQLLGALTRADGSAVVSVAGCPLTIRIVAGAGAIEVAVHGWDVARACGHDRPVPPRLAEELLQVATLLITEADRPARFAPPLPLPDRAGPSERLVAFTGRDPGWRTAARSVRR
ncbi:TIGR03086 family metal-binding protein [Allosalinactinospora lopnorensis]|uniref:TIGR03086 family metal-binding protein n=1 Tax=Allosalinactinospora lopnorensis TaxID=1352348 RepID=UPI000623D47A|nr:TIGR03086 family metal-binding protein [Allosalinactinospora lopnorensis]